MTYVSPVYRSSAFCSIEIPFHLSTNLFDFGLALISNSYDSATLRGSERVFLKKYGINFVTNSIIGHNQTH